uniref:Uncharacterized protein n=1 Tax=Aegilops tauschii subsp. strangulata TaxID=200361 RepID=A0A453MJ81_AEGTS
ASPRRHAVTHHVHGRLLHPAPVPLHERWRCGSHPCLSQLDLDERAAAGSASPDASCGAVTAHSPSPRGASLLLPSTRCLSTSRTPSV